MRRLSLLLPVLALAGCTDKTSLLSNYCGNYDGDAFCAREDPERPFCVLGHDECFEAANLDESANGCVAAPPPTECSTPCGVGNEDACTDPTDPSGSSSGSSSTTGEPSSTTQEETGTDTVDPTTTGPECSDNTECMDPALPFCIDDACAPCSASVEVTPDEACSGLDEATPLCVDDSCVQCTGADASACSGTTPLCDDASNTCVACSFHEECQDIGSPACNLATGACFDPSAVTEVSLSSVSALQDAIDAIADGSEHAIVITGGNGSPQAATVDGGKTVAIVSNNTTVRSINGNTAAVLTVTGSGTTALLHRVRLEGSNGTGITVTSSASLFADSTQVAQNAGGGITLASGTSAQLRNTMIGANVNTDAVDSSGANLEVLYSTLVGNGAFGDNTSLALSCSGGSVTVRNSITVSRASAAVSCPGSSISNTIEAAGGSYNESWFDLDGGDLSLNDGSDFEGEALWEEGDPPFDYDGDARPNTDGAADYAGADIP
jgi:hypothetical protein